MRNAKEGWAMDLSNANRSRTLRYGLSVLIFVAIVSAIIFGEYFPKWVFVLIVLAGIFGGWASFFLALGEIKERKRLAATKTETTAGDESAELGRDHA